MEIKLQPIQLPFVESVPARLPVSPRNSQPWMHRRPANEPALRRSRVLLVCGLGRQDSANAEDLARTLHLVDVARAVFDAGGVDSDVLDLSRLTADCSHPIQPCGHCVSVSRPVCSQTEGICPNQAINRADRIRNDVRAGWAAADGVLILTPAHWRQTSSVLQMMIDRGVDLALAGRYPDGERGSWSQPPGEGRAYGLVVHGDMRRSLEVRRTLCDWLDWMGLIDACEQARLDHFLGIEGPVAPPDMLPDAEAALDNEMRSAAWALVRAMTEIRAGRLGIDSPLLARAWPR